MAFNFGSIPFVARARPSGGGALTRSYLGSATTGIGSNVTDRTVTLPVTFNAGTRYVVAIGIQAFNLLPNATLTIGGTSFDRRLVNTVDDDGAMVLLFEGVPTSNATTGTFGFGLTTTTFGGTYFCYSISSGAVWQGGVVTGATTGNQRDASQNVGAGNLLIGVAVAFDTTADLSGMTWVGLTADGFAAPDIRGYAASAENVSAATPRTITADRVGTTNNNSGFQIAVGRWA